MASQNQKSCRELRLILGDQLNRRHGWFQNSDAGVLYLIAELRQETDYVKHHVQKVCGFFAAMARFATELQESGHRVLYLTLDETGDDDSLPALIQRLAKEYGASCFSYQRPDEYRLYEQLQNLKLGDEVSITMAETDHFLLPYEELASFFTAGKASRMEAFYRKMRQRLDVLMDDGEPEGGAWNYDQDNRNRLDEKGLEGVPEPHQFDNDVGAILDRLDRHGVATFGKRVSSLPLAIDPGQARALLDWFCTRCLPNFGRYQDAMTDQSPHAWSLYHSRLSFALNTKLLDPREVVEAAQSAYRNDESMELAQVEGFIRQVLGWREFIRGVYWLNMPEYAALNGLKASRDLPEYFWTAETRMNCMKQAIGQSLEHAYAHHIQRLMITGNFCLLAGIDPDQVDAWYLGIYHDALEWVELPNTRGMALHADGGLVGSKPYAASANYINKMSDYCKSCTYQAGEKTGEDACPFNSLYWQFMVKHRENFENNHRLRMLYGSWDRMNEDKRDAVLATARDRLENLETL